MPQNNQLPELKLYGKISLRLNGNLCRRKLNGISSLTYLTLDFRSRGLSGNQRNPMGVVVIRGNSVEMVECLEQVNYRK
ncbi:hypothetical protein ABK040_005216 [Willaertia magna]